MNNSLASENLILDKTKERDRSDFYALLNNPKAIELCFSPLSQEEIRDSFESRLLSWSKESESWLSLSIFLKPNNTFVGVTGFKVSQIRNEAEVGFIICPEYHGQGIAAESLSVVIGYAESIGYTSVIANVTEGNIPSCKVLQRSGFELVEVQPEFVKINELKYTNLVYRKVLGGTHNKPLKARP